jgi:hypothetical protein
LYPFADFQLPDVKRFRLRCRAEAGVHFLIVARRIYGVRPVVELDEFVFGGWHGGILSKVGSESKV